MIRCREIVASLSVLALLAGCASKNSESVAVAPPAPPAPPPPPAPVVSVEAPAPPPEVLAVANSPIPAELTAKIDAYLDDPRFASAFWGAKIKSLDTGEVWYTRNSNKLFMPASNEKIPTAATALVTLGPDWKFETHFCATGPIEDGTLKGDLVVFGNGDPTLYTRFYKDSRDVFREVAADLKAQGITHITGDIVGDDNAWDDQSTGMGWTLGGLPEWWSAEFGALSFNENYVDITIKPPATADGAVELVPNVPSSYFTIVNKIEVRPNARGGISIDRPFGSNTITLTGSVAPGGSAQEKTATITNTTLFYVTVLKETLVGEGIAVDGKPVDCDDRAGWKHKPADFQLLHTHQSPELSKILAGLLKRSQNMYAETMVRAVSWNKNGRGTFDEGRRVVTDVLKGFDVEPGTYSYSDGSGLTRYDYTSPDILVKILEGMRKNEHWQVWYDCLPIAGVDGTLRNRMKGTPAEGNVHAKTGTISNTRGLSGYVKTADGENLVFSFLVNSHLTTEKATEDVTDGILAILAGYSKNAPVAGN